ncbi:unnamed protein product [Rotaria sp. Silwood2]|nr:unnamed protein product [Rotaria sp. Silwood2]CAF4386601.1 unnamed protein product [Rotaria sp. Silwood2]CAF4638957.1 unnamed protein product [Rotaria sp. Silwood2]
MLPRKINSVLTSTYENSNPETSSEEEINKGEWITPKQHKKQNHKSQKSSINVDNKEHQPSRTRLFKRSIEHLFKQIPSNKLITSNITPEAMKASLMDTASTQKIQQQVSYNPHLHNHEIQKYHPFIIKFQSQPTISPLDIIQNVMHEWEKMNNNLLQIKITGRQGHDGFLIFPMDQQSFNNLMTGQWPSKIANLLITVKQPRVLPSENSLIIHRVFKDWNITEINNKLKEHYSNFRNAVRIIAKNGTPTQLVRADFNTSKSVQQLLNEGHILIGQSLHQVRAYFAPVRILMCYKCHHHDHSTSQCTNVRTCFRCNTFHDLGQICTRPIQCANCQQSHYSGHSSCPQVQQIRQKLKEQQTINRNKLLIQNAFDLKSENFPPLPSVQHTSTNTSSNFFHMNNTQPISTTKTQNLQQSTTIAKHQSKNIHESIEQILLAQTQQIGNIIDQKFNQIMKQTVKLHKNVNEINDNNQKIINIITDKIVPVINTLTSILNSNISDSTMQNILNSILQTLNDECNHILKPTVTQSTTTFSIKEYKCP